MRFRVKGFRDITLDQELMESLAMGVHPSDVDTLGRCLRMARWLQLDNHGRLWAFGKCYPRVEVVPIAKRLLIVWEAHAALGYPHGQRLY